MTMNRREYLENKAFNRTWQEKIANPQPLTWEEVCELDTLQWPEILAFANSNVGSFKEWEKKRVWKAVERDGKPLAFRNFL